MSKLLGLKSIDCRNAGPSFDVLKVREYYQLAKLKRMSSVQLMEKYRDILQKYNVGETKSASLPAHALVSNLFVEVARKSVKLREAKCFTSQDMKEMLLVVSQHIFSLANSLESQTSSHVVPLDQEWIKQFVKATVPEMAELVKYSVLHKHLDLASTIQITINLLNSAVVKSSYYPLHDLIEALEKNYLYGSSQQQIPNQLLGSFILSLLGADNQSREIGSRLFNTYVAVLDEIHCYQILRTLVGVTRCLEDEKLQHQLAGLDIFKNAPKLSSRCNYMLTKLSLQVRHELSTSEKIRAYWQLVKYHVFYAPSMFFSCGKWI